MGKFFDGAAGFLKKNKVKAAIAAGVVMIGAVGFAFVQSRDVQPGGETVIDPDHKHQYTSEVVQATCGHAGGTLYTCECGDSYIKDSVAALEHEYGDWKVVEAAGVDHPGQKERRCLHCNHRLIEEIPQLTDHKHDYEKEVTKATCTEAGLTILVCQTCNARTLDSEEQALGHKWSDWETMKEATKQKTGERVHSCETCGETETEVVAKIVEEGHKHTYKDEVVEATCTEVGYTKHTCKDCGQVTKDNYLPERGHLYGNWKVKKHPTATEAGSRECVCVRCDYVLKEEIPALGAETAGRYEGHIDKGITLDWNGDGWTSYCYGGVCVLDTRTWGDPPTIRISKNGGFDIVYYKADGIKVNVALSPVEGYMNSCFILEDGTYTTGLNGDFSD